jgi:hypothetical protein
VVQIDEPESIQQGWGVEVNGVTFFLIYRERVAPGLLFIDCEFGEIPKGREADAYRALLETNHLLYHLRRSAFTVSSVTRRVIFSNHYQLDELDAAGLYAVLSKLSDQAKAWQSDYFLKPKTRQSGLKSTQARLSRRLSA